MSFPFHDKDFEFTQPDGTTLSVKGWGDQHYAVFETLDGFTIVQDPITRFYCYAKLSADGSSLESTGIRVGLVDPRSIGLSPKIRINPASAKRLALSAVRAMTGQRRCDIRRQRAAQALRLGGPVAAPPARHTVGEFVGLCLLIQFPDVPGTINPAEVADFCNKPGYAGNGNNGSVFDYFVDNSKDKFKYTNIVTAYYTAKNPRAYYTNPQISFGSRARELILEALASLKAKGFDASPLSADDEEYIYAVNVFYAGACVNNWSEGLWPHSWALAAPFQLAPGRLANDYQITNMGSALTIATFCHENGHMVVDFPDLYDYGYESTGAGNYCLMGYGGPDDKNPTQIGAYLKNKAGWATRATAVTDGLQASIAAGDNDFFLYAKNPTEYFIIENRQQQGRDKSLPASGLAIWHVDELGSNDNQEMTVEKHYECSLEQADNRFDLEHNANYGDAKDLFYRNNNDRFSDVTSPSGKWWDGGASGLDIFNISEAGMAMTFSAKLFDGGDTQRFHASSAPAKNIPDKNTTGIRDTIRFADAATLVSIRVTVDITHTYRGDLCVTLYAPSGTSVVLHNRAGGGADNLKSTFDVTTTSGLRNLVKHPIAGDWVLHVQDLAARDTGRLNSWEIDIEGVVGGGDEPEIVNLEESPGVAIPDNNPAGIERTLSSDAAGNIKDISVAVDITHTYIGDLMVTLVSPQGISIALHSRTGGGTDNIIKTYTLATATGLQALVGKAVAGQWKLKVADVAGRDVGKLNRWALKIVRNTA